MRYKNVLVTGAAGLLGRSVVPQLLKRGYNVIAIDINEPKFNDAVCIQGDFCNVNLMKFVLKDVDAIIHLAAMLGVDQCRLHPKEVIKVNYKDTKGLIDIALKNKVKKFVFTSSSEIYGNSNKLPYLEDAKPTPLSTYGKSKVLVEKYLKKVNNKNGFRVGITRLFNVYGFNQRPTFVVPIFIQAALEGKPLRLFGDGLQSRCFTYVEDAAAGIVKMLEYEKKSFDIINIGRNKEYTMRGLAEIILKNLPSSRSKIEYVDYGKGGVREIKLEIRRRVPSVEKAKKLLGFEAKTSLEQGVKIIISKWKKHLQRPIP